MSLPDGQFRLLFTAKDYDASVAFYRDALQLPLDHNWDYGPADRGTVLKANGGLIEIFALAPGATYVPPQGIWMSIQVDDADRWHRLALERGLTVLQEPISYPWGHRILKLQDPNGIAVWLFSLVETARP